jgi:hypothetical protein
MRWNPLIAVQRLTVPGLDAVAANKPEQFIVLDANGTVNAPDVYTTMGHEVGQLASGDGQQVG